MSRQRCRASPIKTLGPGQNNSKQTPATTASNTNFWRVEKRDRRLAERTDQIGKSAIDSSPGPTKRRTSRHGGQDSPVFQVFKRILCCQFSRNWQWSGSRSTAALALTTETDYDCIWQFSQSLPKEFPPAVGQAGQTASGKSRSEHIVNLTPSFP